MTYFTNRFYPVKDKSIKQHTSIYNTTVKYANHKENIKDFEHT